METFFILERVNDEKFPFRLAIRDEERTILALRVQDKWPGQKGNIFCLREEGREFEAPVEEVERVPVKSIKRFGKRLSIVLDRAKNKRCDFLFLKKKYKKKEGEYEQIFWRTQKVLTERKTKFKLSTYHSGKLNIIIDSNEKYPWSFPNSVVVREKLPLGDYALKEKEGILAVVERKTFENLLAEFGRMAAFHQQLAELTTYEYSALVIEAAYMNFLNPKKQKHYSTSFAAKAIGEIHAMHPGLTVVFAGNRKLANEWTFRFFEAVASHKNDTPPHSVMEIVKNYKP